MSEAKIEIQIGQVHFSGQGEQDWVSKQLDKILAQAEKLIQLAPDTGESEGDGGDHKTKGEDESIARKTLPEFLDKKNAKRNQSKKFLATAVWLHAKGKPRLQTGDVTSALTGASQTKLTNASDCRRKNVSRGYCEMDGKQFFVTDDGKTSL